MNRYKGQNIRLKKNKAGRSIIFLTIFLLLAAVIVFTGVFLLRADGDLHTMDLYIEEAPIYFESLDAEFRAQKLMYEKDALVRGEYGLKFYLSDLKPSNQDTLEWVRSMCEAESVSLVDGKGNFLRTSGPVPPKERLQEQIKTLEPHTSVVDIYSDSEDDSGYDGSVLVMIPLSGESDQNLLFEFTCEPLVNVYEELDIWPNILFEELQGDSIYAFVKSGDNEWKSYPENTFDEQQMSRLRAELTIDSEKTSGNNTDTRRFGLKTYMGRICLSASRTFAQEKIEIVMAKPLGNFFWKNVFTALTLFGFIAINIIFFYLYVMHCTQHGSEVRDKAAFRHWVRSKTMPGLLIILFFTACFTVLYLMLGEKSIIAQDTIYKRLILQSDINWHEKQKNELNNLYSNFYLRLAKVTSRLLEEPKYKTQNGLQELADITQADYLMLFDEKGDEIVSSNSYTGFSVTGENSNLSEEFQSMVLGYPSIVVGPQEDPYTQKMQISAAVLLKKEDGTSDGFLLCVFDTNELVAALDLESMESTVSNFPTTGMYMAAVANKESGLLIAHTDITRIGHEATEYFDEDILNRNYEGFTKHDGETAYVSAFFEHGNTILMIRSHYSDEMTTVISALLIVIVLLLELLEYLLIYKICGNFTTDPETQSGNQIVSSGESVLGFLRGYILFLTVVAVVERITYSMGIRTSFTFVFERQWSRGVHLFSLWAVLFILSVTLCFVMILRMILARTERSVLPRGRTIIKMIDNVICYLSGFFLIFAILYIFGVQGVVLVAIASSISMAFGFGARNVTADFLSGVFVIVENSVHVGDKVRVDQTIGHITNMGLRTIEVTDEENNVMIINNSQVFRIVNLSNSITKSDTADKTQSNPDGTTNGDPDDTTKTEPAGTTNSDPVNKTQGNSEGISDAKYDVMLYDNMPR